MRASTFVKELESAVRAQALIIMARQNANVHVVRLTLM